MIDSSQVLTIFLDCMFKEEELVDGNPVGDFVVGKGVMMDAGFNPVRLNQHKEEIIKILEELPDSFKKSGGGGMSFLNMCLDKEGKQWGEHRDCDHLIMLGNAIKKVDFPLPREMWSQLPGSVPYVTIDL